MTDKNTNDKNEAGADDKRVVGTPTETTEVVTEEASARSESEHNGPYSASETHHRPEEQQRRGERIAALWFVIAFLGGIGFLVSY